MPIDGSPASAQATGGRVPGVDLEHGEVEVAVGGEDARRLAPVVGEHDGGLVAAQVVGVREHAAVADDDAAAEPPAAAEADDRRADRRRRRAPMASEKSPEWQPWSRFLASY